MADRIPFGVLPKRAFVCLLAVSWAAFIGSDAARAELVFDNPVLPYGQSEQPFYIVSGDFDGDGILDLATGDLGDEGYPPADLVIHLGTGGGEFSVAIHLDQPPGPMKAADLDGDGRADLIVAESAANRLAVLRSLGGGAFAAPLYLGTGVYPYDVLAQDLTGDGTVDLATADYYANGASVFVGFGDGSFGPRLGYVTGPNPNALAAGDFNGDGTVDLVFPHTATGAVSILLGDGAGGFTAGGSWAAGPLVAYEDFTGLACGRFNADAFDDCAVARDYGTNLLLANGTGGLDFDSTLYWNGAVAVTDMNGDGLQDLARGGATLLGAGDGTFPVARRFPNGDGAYNFTLGDFNADGTPDVGFANHYRDSVSVLFGNGDGGAGTLLPSGRYPVGIAEADFNEDGLQDLVTVNEDSWDVSVLLADPGGTFQPETRYSACPWPLYVAAGDVTGDGHSDIVVATFTQSSAMLLAGDGAGGFAPAVPVPLPRAPVSLHVADVTGDGLADLVLTRSGIFVMPSLGGGTFGSEIATSATGFLAGMADLNGDGTADLVMGRNFDAVPMLGQGDGTFVAAPAVPFGDPYTYYLNGVAPGDLDADGIPDLVLVGEGAIGTAFGTGDGSFGPTTLTEVGYDIYAQWASVVDLTMDGTPDLAAQHNADLALYRGTGDGAFELQGMYNIGAEPWAIQPGDFNRDGLPDLAFPCASEDAVSLLLNRESRPPVARAGEDRGAECGAPVALDGSASSDASGGSGGITAYRWFEHYGEPGQTLIAEGEHATATLSDGTHTVTLEVTDAGGKSSTDALVVTVADTLPPAGGITAPAAGSCHGPGALPVAITDDFSDLCSSAVARDYAPAGDAGTGLYASHGDHDVTVTATDASGHAALAAVAFTIDLQPPAVAWQVPPRGPWVLPRTAPFASGWVASDDDGATGGIVREVLSWDGCPLFDGATYGTTKDGLLSNETIRLDRSLACRALELCGVSKWTDPVLRIEVSDCGGNTASDAITIPGRISVSRDSCASSAPAGTKHARPSAPAPATSIQRGGAAD